MSEHDLLEFVDDQSAPAAAPVSWSPWRILVVDDDEDVHETMRFSLQGMQIEGRGLQLLHANSAASALRLLSHEQDIAVVVLDVVMETEQAGLDVVARIRGELGLTHVRIVLHTGQPGRAPEIETIQRYDINDYRTKGELTRAKLFVALTAAIRSYRQLQRIEAGRLGLERIVEASSRLLATQEMRGFAECLIAEAAQLAGLEPQGLACVRLPQHGVHGRVVATLGAPAAALGRTTPELGDRGAAADIELALAERRHVLSQQRFALFMPGREGRDLVVLTTSGRALEGVDLRLLDVFCANAALSGSNLDLLTQLRDQAYLDRALGLPNRFALVQEIDQAVASGRARGRSLALLDVDNFSETNDIFGHAYGDKLLVAIARRLAQGLPRGCMLARVSGDAFGVWGPDGTVEPGRLAVLLARPFEIDGVARPVSVSMGLVCWQDGMDQGMDLVKDATIALKQAKATGRNGAQYYTAEVGVATRERTRLLHGLREALERGQLHLVYQPQLALGTGRVVGAEALLRWQDERGRFVSPAQFIPVAEESGLIVAIGHWVLRTALQALGRLRSTSAAGLRMAVNVSPVQFGHPEFLDQLDAALAEAGVPPACLELEITESVAVMGMERVVGVLREIKARGIAVAIDDFGTGFSSLSYLDRLPADRLKIDRAFVTALDDGQASARIAEMIVPLGHRLGMQVLAEGVETASQVQVLRDFGCDEVQGYLYARPMVFEAFADWLAARASG